MYNDQQLQALAQQLGTHLVANSQTLSTAESCSGGWIAKCITDINGSSNWFEAGIVTYSNKAKTQLLDVKENLLLQHGAVSQPVVMAMVAGALTKTKTDFAVAVSGIAGPGGGSEEKPVGLVHFAWASKKGWLNTEQHVFSGDREAVRRQTVATALRGLIEQQTT